MQLFFLNANAARTEKGLPRYDYRSGCGRRSTCSRRLGSGSFPLRKEMVFLSPECSVRKLRCTMVSEAAREVLRFMLANPDPTDYQLNRHIMCVHGPEAVTLIPDELRRLHLVEQVADRENKWRHWRLTSDGRQEAIRS